MSTYNATFRIIKDVRKKTSDIGEVAKVDKAYKLDINHGLEQIIEKYNLDAHYPAYRTSRLACAFIKNWLEELSNTKDTFLFISMDEYALQLIRGWSIGDNISMLKISSVEDLSEYIMKLQNVDKIYTVSYTRTIEILHWLWRHDFRGGVESIYDVLENNHIYMQMEYYRFFTPLVDSVELNFDDRLKAHSIDGSYLTLYEYYYQKQRLTHAVSMEDNRRITEKLFFLAICMRNFLEAERILDTMHYNTDYEKCWNEIKELLDRIRKTLTLKNQKHIIIYWLDALSYEYAGRMEYLQERRDHSLYFHNAYTTTPYTNPTLRAMFCGIRQVDDLGYKIKYIGLDNSPLLKDIIDQGYHFSILSASFRKYFDKKYNQYNENTIVTPCSEVFWNLTDQIINEENPTVYLVHALEMHSPRLSVRRNSLEKKFLLDSKEINGQIWELNAQLRFYDEMLGNDPYRVYMSDHGSSSIPLNKLHVPFQVYHAAWKNREVNKLFCYLDFSKIMHQLLIGGTIDDTIWNRQYVPVQDVDYYNNIKFKEWLGKSGLDVLSFRTAYKGVVTSEYVYTHFKTGDELFHKWSDGLYVPVLGMNNAEKDSGFFKELREKAGEFPKELDLDPKFSYAINTYTIYENVKRTVLEAAKLINERFAGYKDGSIALLQGGYHSRQLHAVLTEGNKRKIGGIIDQDTQCLCKSLGYRVYRVGDELPDNIKTILLSSHVNLTELKAEATQIYSNLEIIDIYEYWKVCGYHFSRDFWYGLEEDFEITNLLESNDRRNDIELFVEFQKIVGSPSKGIDIPQKRSRLFRELKHEAEWFRRKKNLDVGAHINEIYENVKKTIQIAAKLLNEKFAEYTDNSIALRSGGYHTMQLCAILTQENKNKIGGIIDASAHCKCENLGYKIYKPGETLPENIKAVLLSSHLNLDELKVEADKLYGNLEIIDIYQYWKDRGYCFRKDFWYGTENDWECTQRL